MLTIHTVRQRLFERLNNPSNIAIICKQYYSETSIERLWSLVLVERWSHLRVFLQMHCMSPHNKHKNNHATMNFTVNLLGLFYQLWTHRKDIFEVARTYQSYRIAYSDARGALLVCTLLPGASDSYRDRINSLFFRMVSIWVLPQLNI